MKTVLAIIVLFAVPLFSQETSWIVVSGVSGRPVAEALDEIERLSGVAVHYEDLRYEHPDDVEDVSDRVWNPKNETPPEERRRVLAPKSRTLSFAIGVDDEGLLQDAAAVEQALGALMAAGSAADLPGRFEADRYDRDGRSDLFLLPTAMRRRDGAQSPHFAVLATPISVSINKMSGAEALSLILKMISEASGQRIGTGMVPFGPLAWGQVTLSADREPAGHVLADLFSQLPMGIGTSSIRMFYGPDVKHYMFNVHPVRPLNWEPYSPSPGAQPPPEPQPPPGSRPSDNLWYKSK